IVPTTHWNSATGASRTNPLALVDETGAPTTATVTWSSNNVWGLPIADDPGNRRLMAGYLDTTDSSTTTVTVAGLPLPTYDVYVMADSDNEALTRTATYRISGAGITPTTINLIDFANTNFNATFTQGNDSPGNYVRFRIAAAGFTLTATPGVSTGLARAP